MYSYIASWLASWKEVHTLAFFEELICKYGTHVGNCTYLVATTSYRELWPWQPRSGDFVRSNSSTLLMVRMVRWAQVLPSGSLLGPNWGIEHTKPDLERVITLWSRPRSSQFATDSPSAPLSWIRSPFLLTHNQIWNGRSDCHCVSSCSVLSDDRAGLFVTCFEGGARLNNI